jgi:hypothetical protein
MTATGTAISTSRVPRGEEVAVYDIRVAGQIDAQWSAWLGGLTITHPHPGEAVISGEIIDQAALHGTLDRIRNLNLPIISVVRIDAEPADHTVEAIPTRQTTGGRAGREDRPTSRSAPAGRPT